MNSKWLPLTNDDFNFHFFAVGRKYVCTLYVFRWMCLWFALSEFDLAQPNFQCFHHFDLILHHLKWFCWCRTNAYIFHLVWSYLIIIRTHCTKRNCILNAAVHRTNGTQTLTYISEKQTHELTLFNQQRSLWSNLLLLKTKLERKSRHPPTQTSAPTQMTISRQFSIDIKCANKRIERWLNALYVCDEQWHIRNIIFLICQ